MDIKTLSPSELFGSLNDVEAKNAPKTLHIAGDIGLLRVGRRVSVVGSRRVSDKGVQRTRSLVRELAANDIIVVSGMAVGVDTIAHRAAMEAGGRTVAVLGTSLDDAYPKENRALQERMMDTQAVVSQFAPGAPMTKRNFPMRNRTMALLSDATIIVEAEESSGTKYQGWEALRLGREVFLMQSMVDRRDLSWPQEMLRYGAQALSKDMLALLIENLPEFTRYREEIAF